MRYLQELKDYMLIYKRTNDLEVIGYSNSDYIGCINTRKSTSGHVFMLAGGTISWINAKHFLNATSTMEIDFVFGFKGTLHGVWLKSFIFELRVVDFISRSLKLYYDNFVVLFMTKSNKSGS